MARTARTGRLNEVRPLTAAHRATTDDDEENDDDEGLAPKVCPGCEYVNPVTSKHCSECGTKLDKDTDGGARTFERKQKAQSKVLKMIGKATAKLEAQIATAPTDGLERFSQRELKLYGIARQSAAFVQGEPGLMSPAEARAFLASKGSR